MKLTDFENQSKEIEERVASFFQRIQYVFQSLGKTVPEMWETGSTFTAAYLMGPDAIIVNLGDTRAYLFRDGNLIQVTRDHTMTQNLPDEGADAEKANQLNHVLTRCFSGKSPDTTSAPRLVCCDLVELALKEESKDHVTAVVADAGIESG